MGAGRYEDTLTPLIRRLNELETQLGEIRAGLDEDPHRISHEMWILQQTGDPGDAWRHAENIANALYRARQAVGAARKAVGEANRITRTAIRTTER
jgi:hypothetical protein